MKNFFVVLLSAGFAMPTMALAGPQDQVQIRQVKDIPDPRKEELGVTITLDVSGVDVERLDRCIARSKRTLYRNRDPERTFGRTRWTAGEEKILAECTTSKCKYELPTYQIKRLQSRDSLEEKKQSYYQAIYEATLTARKQSKQNRIKAHEVKLGACTRHGGFHWLLNGQVKPHDRLTWNKLAGSSRMRPTLQTMQAYNWRVGQVRCHGQTMLFADHYFDDHLELFELRPTGGNSVRVTYHARSRFDFFNSFWARRFKGRIGSAMRRAATGQVKRVVNRCVAQARTQQPLTASAKSSTTN